MYTNEHGVPVDHWDRPLICPPGVDPAILDPEETAAQYRDRTGAIAFTRVSTLAKQLDDTSNLAKWQQRKVAVGMGRRPDLIELVQTLDLDSAADKKALQKVASSAMEAAGASTAANMGSAVHNWIKMLHKGYAKLTDVSPALRPAVENYLRALDGAGLKAVGSEQFVINDELQTAGTFDVFYWCSLLNCFLMGDVKTGANEVDYSHAVTIQTATYARSRRYDVRQGRYPEPLPSDPTVSLLIHMPIATGEVTIYALDLEEGWRAALLAKGAHTWNKKRTLTPWNPAAMMAEPPVAVPA